MIMRGKRENRRPNPRHAPTFAKSKMLNKKEIIKKLKNTTVH